MNREQKSPERKNRSFVMGITLFSLAATVIFMLMLMAMYRAGMMPVPEFLQKLGWFDESKDDATDSFMSGFLSGVAQKQDAGAEIYEYRRINIDEEYLSDLLQTLDGLHGVHNYNVTVSYGGYTTERYVTIFNGGADYSSYVSQKNAQGSYVTLKRVTTENGTVTVSDETEPGDKTKTITASYPSDDTFTAQSEAGIIAISDILAANERGELENFKYYLARSDKASVRNKLILSFNYADSDVDEYCEIDAETGELLTDIASIDGVPYYQAVLADTQ